MKLVKNLYLFILFAAAITPAFSQQKVLDSLFAAQQNAKSDKERVALLNAIASEYIENDPEKMMEYARKALTLAQKKELREQEADSWLNIGNANIMMSRYTDALISFSNSQDILEKLLTEKEVANEDDIKSALARAYGSIGIVCSEQNNYAGALKYYFKALKIYQDTKQEDIVARLYNNIGIVYKTHKEYDKALDYFRKALEVQKKIGDNTSAITITNIGNIYLAQDKNDRALQSYNEALSIFQEHENKRGEGELYNNLGNYYNKTGDTAKAEKSYKKALEIFDSVGEKYGTSASLAFLGTIYAKQGESNEALDYLKRSSVMAEEIGVLEQVKDSEKSISELYEEKGNYKEALIHYKKYSVAKDSINNAENIKNMVREEMNYEMERKEALQKTEAEKREAIYKEQNKRYRQQMLFIGVLAVLLFGLAFVVYNRLQLKKTLTLQRDLAEYEQKALHLQMNPHFVFNCLGSISSFIVQNGTDSAIKYLSKFSKLMRLTLEYSKESLIPIDSEIEGLQNYLELEQLRFNQMFDFSITKDPNIEDDMAIPPLLLQPFVENAIIHGIVPKKEKGSITIDFALVNDKLVCTVIDDGIGFSKSKELKENSVTVHKSMALEITRKRLEVIQAFTSKTSQVEIKELFNDEGVPAGTKIILNLPIQYASNRL
ncbi:tetratricopeptide repeat protein [Flavobacterium salilacus subsp. salilacus]|uniref:tetratricopeptide repeat-containing sensor histidine kinase n=1 Tax=Flavobacterium TaxID=237 RepID=UPI0013C2CBAA|nr:MULTISPECIES: tetratricopeptide repeat protein [Flavobacterium]KAF2519801.1 tetratricopeptide repeat protein [Flavobacterium salilacus subsp. salilacus]MBE1614300.1 tetratricopeptide repeat protein [Flavobacterium sp. SaA2.13]